MSEQVDTRALRAHSHELREMHFDIDEGDDSLYVHGGVDGGIYPVESLLRRNKDAIVAILNAAPALLDEVDGLRAERDGLRATRDVWVAVADTRSLDVKALRARVAELEREVERVRDSNCRLRDAVRDAIETAERTLPQSCGRFMVRDVRIGDAQVELWRAALAPRAEVKP